MLTYSITFIFFTEIWFVFFYVYYGRNISASMMWFGNNNQLW